MQKVQDDVFPELLLAGLDTAALGQQIAARQRSLAPTHEPDGTLIDAWDALFGPVKADLQ